MSRTSQRRPAGPVAPDGHPPDAWFAQLEGELRAFVRARVSDPSSADDVLQEALLRIVRGLESLQDGERLGAWARTVARRAVVDHYRRYPRAVPEPDLDAHAPAPDDDDDVPPASRHLAGWLRAAIETLPEPYRGTLRATELEGQPYQVLAAREGVSVSAIKSRVQRGRAKLRAAAERCCEVQLDSRGTVIGLRRRGVCGCGE